MDAARIGVMVDSFRLGLRGGVEKAASLGVGAVQISALGELAPANLSAQGRADVRSLLCTNGLALSAVCGDLGGHGLSNSEENEWKLPEYKRILDLTAELGCKVMTTHIGVIPDDAAHPRYAVLYDAMAALCQHAVPLGVKIAIETGPEPVSVLKAFVEGLPGGVAGANYDPANLVMVLGVDPVAGVSEMAGRIVHTHVKDGRLLRYIGAEAIYGFFAEGGIGDMRMSDYFIETPLGEGDVDLPAWLRALTAVGYDGYLTIEREVGDDPSRDIAKAIEFLKNIG